MNSNMSCLTKKSLLLLMVLFIICNPTSSVGPDECIANVRHIFNEGMLPYFAFEFAMFSLSETVIQSMTTAAELANYFKTNKNAIFQYENISLNSKQQEIIEYFCMLVDETETRSNASLESKIEDIHGYFKSLIYKIENGRFPNIPTISPNEPSIPPNDPSIPPNDPSIPPNQSSRFIIEPTRLPEGPSNQYFKTFTMSPKQFCEEKYHEEEKMCRDSLSVMFRRSDEDFEKMEIKEAFIFCYLHYTHLDFTMAKMFSATGSATTEENEMLQWALSVMVNYYSHLMDVAFGIGLVHMNYTNLFPTVEQYCRGEVQTIT